MKKIFKIWAITEFISAIILIFLTVIFETMNYGFIGFILALGCSLIIISPTIIICAIYKLLDRVQILEDKLLEKEILKETDLKSLPDEEIVPIEDNVEDFELCRKCGFQLFKEDVECPNCHTKRN